MARSQLADFELLGKLGAGTFGTVYKVSSAQGSDGACLRLDIG